MPQSVPFPLALALGTVLAGLGRAPAQAAPGARAPSPVDARAAEAGADRGHAGILAAARPRLQALLLAGIEQTTPSANLWRRQGQPTIFDGSYDWHSCIAAHWALLCMARVHGDSALAARIAERLSPAALEQERKLFRDPAGNERAREAAPADVDAPRATRARRFFVPYADAWFLLVLAELQRVPGRDDEALRALRAETEHRLLTWLATNAVPPGSTEEADLRGDYRAWLFPLLALQLAGTSDESRSARLATLLREQLAPRRERFAAARVQPRGDFLDVRALHALVERLDGACAAPIAYEVPAAFEALPESVSLRDCHVLGRLLSATWPLAVDGLHDPRARAAFEARHVEVLAREELWADDFVVVAHWIPQFLWLGLWLAQGRP